MYDETLVAIKVLDGKFISLYLQHAVKLRGLRLYSRRASTANDPSPVRESAYILLISSGLHCNQFMRKSCKSQNAQSHRC
jgi:hypothetical protein